MTLPLFYAEDLASVGPFSGEREAWGGVEYLLRGTEGHHAAVVRRLGPGEQLLLSDGAGLMLRGTVVRAEPTDPRAALRVCITGYEHEPEMRPRLILIQALAKDGRDEAAIEAATELGVDAVIPWQADRSIVRWKADRQAKAMAKWQHVLLSAAKQSRRARIPSLKPCLDTPRLFTFLESAAMAPDDVTVTAVLHEEAELSIPAFLKRSRLGGEGSSGADQLLLIVGPEGGMSQRELEGFTAQGGIETGGGTELVRLGPHVLRSSTAGPAALAVVSQLLGRWDA